MEHELFLRANLGDLDVLDCYKDESSQNNKRIPARRPGEQQQQRSLSQPHEGRGAKQGVVYPDECDCGHKDNEVSPAAQSEQMVMSSEPLRRRVSFPSLSTINGSNSSLSRTMDAGMRSQTIPAQQDPSTSGVAGVWPGEWNSRVPQAGGGCGWLWTQIRLVFHRIRNFLRRLVRFTLCLKASVPN